MNFLFVLLLIALTGARDPYKHRELKGGRGGGGRSSSRSSYKSSNSGYKVSNGVYKFSTVKSTPTRSNTYWDGGKTYQPLYVYYLPPNYYNAAGYYSITYG